MTHPLTDEICKDLVLRFYWSARASYSDRLKGLVSREVDTADNMRTAADWQLEQVMEWLKFGYQTDPNLSLKLKKTTYFTEIAIVLEKAMRPQEDS